MKLTRPLALLVCAATMSGACMATSSTPAQADSTTGARSDVQSYPDVLDLHGAPAAAQPATFNPLNAFSDLGAWQAYGLPKAGDTADYGGFTGPMYIAQEYPWYLSRAFSRIQLRDLDTGQPINLAGDSHPQLVSYPGKLVQLYQVDGLQLRMTLEFADSRTALVRAEVSSRTGKARRIGVSWSGQLLLPTRQAERDALTMRPTATGVAVDFAKVRDTWAFMTGGGERFAVRHAEPVRTSVSGSSYTSTLERPLDLRGRATSSLTWTESYTFTAAERAEHERANNFALAHPQQVTARNDSRWQGYLRRALSGVSPQDARVAVKSVQTLITNWRSPAGELKSDGITPSLTYKWFTGGFWAWDSWKEAVGVAAFDPQLAESTIRSVFDHQVTADSATRPQDAGMVPDCVFYNDPEQGGGNWNERNSKPPLASWSVWEVYQQSHDKAFLAEMYPKLMAFQGWWYRNRDHDHNGIAEYGATVDPQNATPADQVQAAAWESGMDNAPRFDKAGIVPNTVDGTTVGYSVTQESVDLNAYLVADATYLAKIAGELGQRAEARSLTAQATKVSAWLRDHAYDAATGWFYDVDSATKAPMVAEGRGIEGAIPLWAGVASPAQASGVRGNLSDPGEFGTYLPYPTVAVSSPSFSPTAYWRGPDWLDQAYFAMGGLRRYGYGADANTAANELLTRADGLMGQGPIRENYNPQTGAGLNSTNFSWSAAVILSLTRNSY